mmetsp:Transcript_3357/g.10220  ORF Transcript_3357/g.10220 Transcript_3357/m.10220 type:complete len:253 (+) Transcript_3357:29-787(+)|eukprot:CAMPEP_0198726358 /NCGR_PEP_ID=MMETSP1475-20131203/3431_1 /TAXON_ID= ORGANISM="Unidentified sp., Strain CCMP1999" /NCGR_SAMPLE_ID=MMETSP1475 /ASSEMBLY_ACC=CAM_ASM_001111 /LENGTH=252 /DNA_ID=CAMNT_0044488265 /DNA_START=48 /DNA_END=806 /DNA_ORIENTATION=+
MGSSGGFELLKQQGDVIVPGDVLAKVVEAKEGETPAVVRLGPGVRRNGLEIAAIKAGVVRVQPERSKVWVETGGRRYIPALEDMVIGVIQDRHADGYRVDIGAPEPAQLGNLSFEGATKRNRPFLNPGDLVYARVITADRDLEPELSCVQPGSNKSWVSGESLFGELKGGGQLLRVSLAAARALLRPDCALLSALGESISRGFECVVGANGRVWVRAHSPRDVISVTAAIRMADARTLGDDPVKGVKALLST